MKRGPLSNDEKSYIEKNSTKTVTAISKKLNRTETIVAGHLETVKDNVPALKEPNSFDLPLEISKYLT